MYHYFNIVSDRFTREIIHKLELSSRTRPSSRAYIAKIQIQRGIRICSFFLPAMIILLEHAIRLGDGAILCSRDTDQLSAEISIVPITLSRKSRNHVSPYFVACRTPRWIRASPRERTKFFLSTREKKEKEKEKYRVVEERVKNSPMDFLYHEQVCVHGWKEESSKSFLDRRLKLADPSRSGGNAKRFSPGNRRIAEEEEEEEDGVRVHH